MKLLSRSHDEKIKVSMVTFFSTLFFLIFVLQIFLFSRTSTLNETSSSQHEKLLRKSFYHASDSFLNDQTNVLIPKDKNGDQLSVEDRLRYLELKVNSYMHFGSDPFFGATTDNSICQKKSNLVEYGCKEYGKSKNPCPGFYDNYICLDNLPKPDVNGEAYKVKPDELTRPCLVYDFGIRTQPEFGETMARYFGCEVHAFDPSPISTKWWKEAKDLQELPNYHFHSYGAGGTDGSIKLKEYNWGQVSILRYPSSVYDCDGQNTHCKRKPIQSESFFLPVKTLPTIIKELGHEGRTIDILKIDVEGSEYAFLENLLDSTGGCPSFINQISLEWHHFPFDPRYGEGASPPINAIVTLLHTCGLKNIYQHSEGGYRNNDKIYFDMDMKDVRYNLVTFYRAGDTTKK